MDPVRRAHGRRWVASSSSSESLTLLRCPAARREGEGFLIVYSTTSRASFDRVERFRHQVARVKDSDSVPVVLVGNKIDRVHEREVETRHGEELAKRLGCAFIETSAKTRVNLEEAYFMAVRMSASLSLFFLTPSESTQLLTLLGACPQSRLGKAARRPSPCGRRPRSSGNARSFERARLASPRTPAPPLPPAHVHTRTASTLPLPHLFVASPMHVSSLPLLLLSSSPTRPLLVLLRSSSSFQQSYTMHSSLSCPRAVSLSERAVREESRGRAGRARGALEGRRALAQRLRWVGLSMSSAVSSLQFQNLCSHL